MRTTGVRSAPSPAPRTAPGAGGPPQPLPRTKFSVSTTLEDSPRERLPSLTEDLPQESNKHSIVTHNVISDHLSPRSRLSKRNKGNEVLKQGVVKEGTGEPQSSVSSSPTKCKLSVSSPGPGDNSPVVNPRPKPPRTFEYRPFPVQEKQYGDSPQPLSTQDPKLPSGLKARDIPARPKTGDVLRMPGAIPVAASDINSSAKPQERTATVASLVEERTPGQGNIASSTPGPSSGTAQVSAIVSSIQAHSKERLVSAPTKGNYTGGSNAPRPNNAWSVATQRSQHRRFPPLSIPSSSVAVRPSVPASAFPRPSGRPLLPSRPNSAQVAASLARSGISRPQRRVNGAPEAFPRPPAPTFLRAASRVSVVDQDSVYTPADFDDNCRRVFQHTRVAEEHMAKERHVQAASEYQAALTAIDRVLRTQVLALTSDEPTRQRFFHLQQEVFYTRKEALNGFSDAQAAITTPRGMTPSSQPQGAPPSYDDVIREDFSRSQDLLTVPCLEEPPSLPARQPTMRGAAVVVGQPPVQRPAQRPGLRLPTSSLAPQPSPVPRPRTSRARSSSLCDRETGMVLVDVSGAGPYTPHTAPVTRISQPLVPIRASLPRPKSSYHPDQEQPTAPALAKQPGDGPAPQPTPHQPGETQGPEPRSVLSHSKTSSLDTRSSSNTNETPVVEPGPYPQEDEAVVHQALALQKFKEKRKEKSLASDGGATKMEETFTAVKNIVASPPKPKRSYSTPGARVSAPGSSPGRGAAEDEGSVSSRQPIMSSPGSYDTSNLQTVHSQAGKDKVLSEENAAAATVVSQTTSTPTVSSTSSVIDPFMTLDPFPSVDPSDVNTDDVFHDGSQPSSPTPATGKASSVKSEDNVKSTTKKDSLQTPAKPNVSANVPGAAGACAGGAAVPEVAEAGQASGGSPTGDHVAADDLGDSILDALDFAVSRTPSQRRAFSQQSKGSMSSRCHSEETLLDYSYRTLENYLDSSKAICASRASIIEEFDPLVSLAPGKESVEENKPNAEESSVAMDDVPQSHYTEPKTAKSKLENDKRSEGKPVMTQLGDEPKEVSSDRACGEEGAMAPARDVHDNTAASGGNADLHDNDETTTPNHIYDESGARSSFSSSGSCLSWPPDYSRNTSCSYPRITPLSADAAGGDPWSARSPDHETSKSRASVVDIGRSAFYAPLSRQQGGLEGGRSGNTVAVTPAFRDLLRIREGVKIFFIYEDGVVTSPWSRPFLAVSKDPNKAWLVGEGLVLRVGDDQWACQLHSKSTLVLRMLSGIYIFEDVAGKPECKAVGVRVPSDVRKVQHELLGQILRENTLLEDERPVGITKAISKGASSAATRMNQYVEDKSMTTNKAFVRKNSIRALKGMSKRLNSLAERTGSSLKELPAEYKKLQEAADTLRFSRNAKTIQYI